MEYGGGIHNGLLAYRNSRGDIAQLVEFRSCNWVVAITGQKIHPGPSKEPSRPTTLISVGVFGISADLMVLGKSLNKVFTSFSRYIRISLARANQVTLQGQEQHHCLEHTVASIRDRGATSYGTAERDYSTGRYESGSSISISSGFCYHIICWLVWRWFRIF